MAAIAPKEAIKDAILDATDRLLARFGYRKMTVEDIAVEAGIGEGTIYLHFASKEEVVLSHVDRIVDRLKQQHLAIIARSEITAPERIRQMLLARVLFRFDSIQHYTQSLNDLLAALRPGLLARRAKYFEEEAQIFAEVLAEGRVSGEFKFDNELATARALEATNGLLPYSLSTAELGEREEVERRTSAIADLLLQGLLSRN
jgi:AcrR family transcriptional regulator